MKRKLFTDSNTWKNFYGPNLGYVQELYEQYKNDPNSVDPTVRQWFETMGAPPMNQPMAAPQKEIIEGVSLEGKKVAAALKYVENIRLYGHLAADIYPLGRNLQQDTSFLDSNTYGLTPEDLQQIPATLVWENAPQDVSNAWDAIQHLKQAYTSSLAFEFGHVHNEQERLWLQEKVENRHRDFTLSAKEKTALLFRLIQVEGFEAFLQQTFAGQKRFGIEGIDIMVPMLDELVLLGANDEVRHIEIGMAHRGRLNVLAHVLGKPYELIFSEFHHAPNKDLVPSEGSRGINYGWSGDVKYHLGADRDVVDQGKLRTTVTLANNPSHLEYVGPVVQGYTRAAQEDRSQPGYPQQDVQSAFSIIIHGDAAFPGEGIVAETFNLSRLRGYQTGGTIHIIANNLLGFTTDHTDARSTEYASDPAKGYEIPIIHVNADDPEACLFAVRLAYEYRMRFNKDILIDLIGYRRYGHNEMDDPAATQPQLYKLINQHPSVAVQYANQLKKERLVSEEEIKTREKEFREKLRTIYEGVRKEIEVKEEEVPAPIAQDFPPMKTAVPRETLREINQSLLSWPEGFNVYPKLSRILKRREAAFEDGGKVEWALAETLAFATILADGKAIRMTGQDSERGTFAQRHLVLHDYETGETFVPLHHIPQAKASFAIYNSPLSEASVLGFEYGYSVPVDTLVIWEAQYGDFVNVAQPIIDQFISAGRAKWGQKSDLIMLLPHGYEGQGPEHSSARLERFLQMSAENNWTVANLTSAAQYFHILRRQALITDLDEGRPLIIMTPKSLLRNPRVASPAEALSSDTFHPVLEQPGLGQKPEQVEKLILCSGKIAVDLATRLEEETERDWSHLQILRIEQLYPFPKEQLKEKLNRYPNLKKVFWVQEEPKNMGAWSFIKPYIREVVADLPIHYIGRPNRSSTATGDPKVHKKEQERIINEALMTNVEEK